MMYFFMILFFVVMLSNEASHSKLRCLFLASANHFEILRCAQNDLLFK